MQVVIATLHAGGASGWASVTVGGLFTPIVRVTPETLAAQIRDSSALECLYDFARASLRTAAGIVDVKLKTPAKSPLASVEPFESPEQNATGAVPEALGSEPREEH